MAYELGQIVGIAVFSCVNPIIWIVAFFVSRGSDRLTQILVCCVTNAFCWAPIVTDELGIETPINQMSLISVVIGASLGGIVVLYVMVIARKLLASRRNIAAGGKQLLASVDASRKTLTKVKKGAEDRISSLRGFQPDNYSDEDFEKALAELESEQTKKATWAKCLALSEGDIQKAKAKYIELRVIELSEP